MNSISENQEKSKRTSVKFSFQSILMLMAAIMMAFATLTSCDEDDENEDDNEISNGVDKDGLTKEIRNIVSDDFLKQLKDLGIEINGGNNPSNIEGSYLVSPDVLVKSNFDYQIKPGDIVADREFTFYEQNNTNLTIMVDATDIGSYETGLGSFIVGSGNKFTIFYKSEGTFNGLPFSSINVISGEITTSGIKNWHNALISTTSGNPYSLQYGQGCLYKDGDGLAERSK